VDKGHHLGKKLLDDERGRKRKWADAKSDSHVTEKVLRPVAPPAPLIDFTFMYPHLRKSGVTIQRVILAHVRECHPIHP
jgi:hypothetical protein